PDPTCTNMYNEPADHPNAGIGGYAGYHRGSLIGGNINIQRRSSIGKTPVMEDPKQHRSNMGGPLCNPCRSSIGRNTGIMYFDNTVIPVY
ncbi:hypothetical protein DL89DRAFT_269107, partial [Linderina pennispora]